jgi:DNA-nicking Smr family endonuclease
MNRRRRPLSDQERALWIGFARSITPLREAKGLAEASARESESVAPVTPIIPSSVSHHAPAPQTKSPPLAPLGRRLRQRVGRGREPIDARFDLHGLTQTEAHAALRRFLHRAQAEGARTVLIVTGKGSGRSPDDRGNAAAGERGVLKRQVPLWLALPEFRALVIGFEAAHASHGGQGALYVRLRRPPSNMR